MPLGFGGHTITFTFAARDEMSRNIATMRKNVAMLGGPKFGPLGNVASGFKSMGGEALLASGGIALVGVAVEKVGELANLAIQENIKFEQGLANINTIARLSKDQLAGVGDEIQAVARDTGTSTDQLTQAEYDLVSAGVKVNDSFGVLHDAAVLARGAMGTTGEGVDLLTTIINAYDLRVSESTRIMDAFAKSVEDGKVTLSGIGQTISETALIARQAGVSYDEIAASYAFLTARGADAGEVMTNMRQAIVALLKPNAELNAIQTSTGINFAELMKAKGLAVALQELRKATEGNDAAMAGALGRVQALNYVLAVTGPHAGAFATELERIGTAADTGGTALGQFNAAMDTTMGRASKLNARMQTDLQDSGSAMSGLADSSLGAMTAVLDYADSLATGWGVISGQITTVATHMTSDAIDSMTRHMDSEHGQVQSASEDLFRPIPEASKDALAEAARIAAMVPRDIAAEIKGDKHFVSDAMDTLTWAFEHPKKLMHEVAEIEGALASKKLGRGLRSNNPMIRQIAEQQEAILIAKWEALTGMAWNEGLNAGQAWTGGYHSGFGGGIGGGGSWDPPSSSPTPRSYWKSQRKSGAYKGNAVSGSGGGVAPHSHPIVMDGRLVAEAQAPHLDRMNGKQLALG